MLRAELERLSIRVGEQDRQIDSLTRALERVGGSVESEEEDFAFVTAGPRVELGEPPSESLSWTERERIARDIGLWLRKCLAGENRGPSGRDKLRGFASKYYLVCKDFTGKSVEGGLVVLTRFSAVKEICYRKGSWGESVFIGLPTIREGKIAALSARLHWPDPLHRQ